MPHKSIKGSKKRRKSYFKRKHPYYPPKDKLQNSASNGLPSTDLESDSNSNSDNINNGKKFMSRLSVPDYDAIVSEEGSSLLIKNQEGEVQDACILRPGPTPETVNKSAECSCKEGDECGYRIFHKKLTLTFFNTANREHRLFNSDCTGDLDWDNEREVKWSLCWGEAVHCTKCSYRSKLSKLFEEVDVPGQGGKKAGMPNVGLQVGLAHTPISHASFRTLCASIGIPPPSVNSLQKSANKVGSVISDLNKKDLLKHQQETVRLSKLKGDEFIAIESDSAYNIPLAFAGTRVCGQPASQVFTTIIENATKNKKVLNFFYGNKHCAVAERIAKSSKEVIVCPNHSGVCTQNLDPNAVIGDEHRNTTIAYQGLVDNGVLAGTITTDGDSRAAMAVEEINASCGGPSVLRQRDPGHLSKSQRNIIKNAKFSRGMFPGALCADRKKQQKRFNLNMSRRCSAECNYARKLLGTNTDILSEKLDKTMKAILLCCQGDHDLCDQHSYVCKSSSRWYHETLVTPSSADEQLLLGYLRFRLGRDAIAKTRLGFTTQKAESVNRSLHRSLPKNVLFKRNCQARAHATVHRVNNGLALSLKEQLKAVGSNAAKSQRVEAYLKSVQSKQLYDKLRKQTMAYKHRRYSLCQMRHDRYHRKNASEAKRVSYAKGLMDIDSMQNAIKNINATHSYAQNMQDVSRNIVTDHTY